MTFLLFLLLSCSTKEECVKKMAFVAADEVYEDWEVSMQDVVDEINRFDTCIWNNDGSITKFDVHLRTMEEHQGLGYDDLQYNTYYDDDYNECKISALFYLVLSCYSEDGELLLETNVPGILREKRIPTYINDLPHDWYGSGGYKDANLPPSNPPMGDDLYGIGIYASGEFSQGDIEHVALRIRDGFETVDLAYCYKE